MSSCNTSLTALPWLPRRQIIDELVNHLGLRKVLTLRAVCGKKGRRNTKELQ